MTFVMPDVQTEYEWSYKDGHFELFSRLERQGEENDPSLEEIVDMMVQGFKNNMGDDFVGADKEVGDDYIEITVEGEVEESGGPIGSAIGALIAIYSVEYPEMSSELINGMSGLVETLSQQAEEFEESSSGTERSMFQ